MQLLANAFELPADGWYQISAIGEFPHNPTGLLQIVDEPGCRSMVDAFQQMATQPNFAGLLIDFDHFSLEKDKPSEAAGWIVGLEHRPNGLWARIRWSDAGEQAVRGGRYRFISPVWRQDECEDLGPSIISGQETRRVRPLKLLNAAVTNDPNIRGMLPLSNRADAAPAAPARIAIQSLRNARDFRRALLLANGMYFDPKTGQTREWVGGRPWGRSGGSRASASAPASTPKPDPTELPVTTDYDQNEYPHIRPLGETPPEEPATPEVSYDPVRDTDARVKALEEQRDAILAQRPPEPKPPDFSQVDTRKLQRELMAQGKGTNEVAAAVKAAETQNQQRKLALAKIRKDIATVYPHDHERQKAALTKYLQQLDTQYQKQHAAWTKAANTVDRMVATANRLIAEEQARGREETARAAQQENNAAATDAKRTAERQAREVAKQVEADKAEARKKATAASKKTSAQKEPDAVTEMSREMRRRQFYWQSIARGEYDIAETIYPEAETAGNIARYKALTPPSRSKANEKAHKAALADLEKQRPS